MDAVARDVINTLHPLSLSNKKGMAQKKVKSISSQPFKSPPELETNFLRTYIYYMGKHIQDDCIYAFFSIIWPEKKN